MMMPHPSALHRPAVPVVLLLLLVTAVSADEPAPFFTEISRPRFDFRTVLQPALQPVQTSDVPLFQWNDDVWPPDTSVRTDERDSTWGFTRIDELDILLDDIDRLDTSLQVIEPEPERGVPESAPDQPYLTLTDELIAAVCGDYSDRCAEALGEVTRWTRRIELGARFRDGNSEGDFIDVAAKFEREDGNRVIGFDLGGQYAQANGEPTTNRWFGNTTIDVNKTGHWILFVTSKNEHDEFENLNYRGTLAGGLGYRFYDEDLRRLIVRIGPGVTLEKFHDPDRIRTTPDLFGEIEVRWPLFERTRLEHKTTINPSAEDVQVFRLVSRYGLVVALDEGDRWSLMLDLRHEYNSRPNDRLKSSDYTTGVKLMYESK